MKNIVKRWKWFTLFAQRTSRKTSLIWQKNEAGRFSICKT